MYADDNVLMSETPAGLQQKLNILHSQCDRLGLKVNMSKTKIIVFRKGGFLGKNEKWTFDNNPIEIVNSYCYLGITFTTKMSFMTCKTVLVSKAKKAMYELLRALRANYCNDINIFCKLFDSKITPILSYGSELLGVFDNYELDKVHTNAIKMFLNVSTHCSNTLLYYDTGRYPLSISLKIRSIKYWLKLLELDNKRICKQAYIALERQDNEGKSNWVSKIKNILTVNGFGVIWFSKTVGNEAIFLNRLKQRLIDCQIQGMEEKINSSTHFNAYSSFKTFFSSEYYLQDINFQYKHRKVYIQFRLGVSELNSHRYRFSNDLEKQLCSKCNLREKESEMHVLFNCPMYEQLRHEILPKNILSQRNYNSFIYLMTNEHISLGFYLYRMFKQRNE